MYEVAAVNKEAVGSVCFWVKYCSCLPLCFVNKLLHFFFLWQVSVH